mgnify:CR=1 FL=1
MTDAAAKLLRNTMAGLRVKASIGVPAPAAIRDLAAILPKQMNAHTEGELESGRLLQRWLTALKAAEELGEDAVLAALLDMLQQEAKLASRITLDFAMRVEGERRFAEGRAQGIEEALGLLAKPPVEEAGSKEQDNG